MAFKLFVFAACLALASAGIISAPVQYATPLTYSAPAVVKTYAAAPVLAHSSSSIVKTVNTVPQVYSAPIYTASAYSAPAYTAPIVKTIAAPVVAAPAVATYSVPTYAKVAAPLTYTSAGWA